MANLTVNVTDGNNISVGVGSGPAGQGVATGGVAGQVLAKASNTDYDTTWIAVGGTGTVTSVGASVPAFLSVSGSPITTAGTLAIGYSGTALPVANGGTGTTTPSLVAGTNVTISGTWPNQTVNATGGGGGSGTVTSVGVAAANGFAGSVANSTTTPIITVSTSITGVLKGNGTAISAATAGTDYQAPITLTTTGSSGAATFVGNTLNIPQYTGGGASGTVTSVAASVPSFLSVTGSPITTNGTLAISYSGTALPIANGGTAVTATPTNGQLLIGNGTGYSLATLTAGSNITITNSAGGISIASVAGGTGTVTSVAQSFTGGLISVAGSPVTSSGILALTVAGTSGGVPYFSSASTWASSAALTQYGIVYGGGAGAAPIATAAGTTGQVLTATTGGAPTWAAPATNGTVTSVAALTLGTTGSDLSSTVANGTSTPVITLNVPTASATNRGVLSAADWTTFNNKGTGTVTSVGFTGGLLSIASATTTPAITVAGTSGGIPYFSSSSTWATSAALAANALVVGGGAGAAPSTVTTGTGVVTALGVNTGSSGAFMVQGSAIISTSTVNDSAGTGYAIGYRQMPQNSQTGATYTLVLADDGKHIYLNTGSTNTITVPTNASVAFPIGTVVTVVNGNSGTCTISGPTSGLQLANGAAATTRTLATKGMATMIKVATDLWYVSGAGVT